MNTTPERTNIPPKICKIINRSSKKIHAKVMVEIGPTLAIIATFDAPILRIDSDINNVGMTVDIVAIKKL